MILLSYSHFNCFIYPFSIVKVQLFIDKTVRFLTSSGLCLEMSGNSDVHSRTTWLDSGAVNFAVSELLMPIVVWTWIYFSIVYQTVYITSSNQ